MPGDKIIDRIRSLQGEGKHFVSFEFFPPKTADGVRSLMSRIERYREQNPLFCDMTWGAGGSTSELTLELCVRMTKEINVETNMHLTCTNMETSKVDLALKGAKEGGIRNIVALRGDPPEGEEHWEAVDGGFSCGLDLVKYIRKTYGDHFGISVSGYPEGHPNAITKVEDPSTLSDAEKTRVVEMEDGTYVCRDKDFETELQYLKEKVDAGADFIITQMVFDAPVYKAFVDACRKHDINVPVVPGIMCIQNFGGYQRMTKFCKSRVPKTLTETLAKVQDDKDAFREASVEFGTALSRDLQKMGAPGLHFYTLNLEKVTLGILSNLGLNQVAEE